MAGLPPLSDQVIAFLGELLDLDTMPRAAVENRLTFALACWNAGTVKDEKIAHQLISMLEQQVASSLGPKATPADFEQMTSMAWFLIERRQTVFGYDPRLMIDFEVVPTGPKQFQLNVTGTMLGTEAAPSAP